MTHERQQIVILQQIANLIACAADLSRAVAYEDGTYILANLSKIETRRSEILMMIYEWKPELLSGVAPP